MDFNDYVAARGQALLRFAYVLSGDMHLAEDLVQTALIKAHRGWRRVSVAHHPEAYVRRVIVNSYLDHRRRRSSHESPVDFSKSGWHHTSSEAHADAIVERVEMWQALASLPRKQRTVLVLRYYEDCPDSTIATILGCAESTVRSNTARGLATLRQSWNRPPIGKSPRGDGRE